MQPDIIGILIYLSENAPAPAPEIVAEALQRLSASSEFSNAKIYVAPGSQYAASGANIKANLEVIQGTPLECLHEIFAATTGDAQDTVAICYGFYALLDSELTRAALADHTQYLAHFTYSENIPAGFVPDFVSRDFIAGLDADGAPELSKPAELSGSGDLRAFAFRNIDRFDVELFYRSPDLRQVRLDLSGITSRSRWLVDRVRTLAPALAFADLEKFLREHPEVLRPYPAYFEVELSAQFQHAAFQPGILPVPPEPVAAARATQKFLSADLIQKLHDDIAANALDQDVTVSFAGAGEPFAHPGFVQIVGDFLRLAPVRQVIIETWGVGIDAAQVDALFAVAGSECITVIVRVDSLQPARYATLYGADVGADVFAFLDVLAHALNQIKASHPERVPRVFAEMHRLAETEDELGAFMDRFDAPDQPIRPLLQKYNRYIDRLPERRAADLTPLVREFCWHLARDFYLTVDGRVPVCKQDPYGENPATQDFSKRSVLEIVAQTMPYHNASVRGEHAAVPMPCLRCDEWYTFNA